MAEMVVAIEGNAPGSVPLATTYQYVAVPPAPSRILAGSVQDDSVVITIPANSVWFGFIAISAAAGAAGTSTVTVATTAATSTPAPAINLASATIVTTAAVDASSVAYTTPFLHVYSGTTSSGLKVSIDGGASVSVEAYGYVTPA